MKYGNISDDVSNDVSERSVSLRCANWLNLTPTETKVERFGLSLWSQRNNNPKREMNQRIF